MEKLQKWIKDHGTVGHFLQGVNISKSFFYEWMRGEKRMSLKIASQIVKFTDGKISFEDLIYFEESFTENQKL